MLTHAGKRCDKIHRTPALTGSMWHGDQAHQKPTGAVELSAGAEGQTKTAGIPAHQSTLASP